MNLRCCFLNFYAPFVVAILAASAAHAQARVGEAVIIQNEVVRVGASASTQINVGDGLLRDEIVRTGDASAARLVMADNTNLSVVLRRRSWPQGTDTQSVAAGGHRLHPILGGRLQRHQRADRRLRAAL
jgi:hypothetical protein